MIFHAPSKCIQPLSLKINNINIETVEDFLGLTIDSN